MYSEKWQNDEQKKIDLQLENKALQDEITLKGGIFGRCEDLDPEIENMFLKNVIAFEEAYDSPRIPMRSLFPPHYKFPPVKSMSKKEISDKLDDIALILSTHNIQLGFNEKLPKDLLYKHLVEDCIPNETVQQEMISGFVNVLDGCTGDCDRCFQKDYCSTAQESE